MDANGIAKPDSIKFTDFQTAGSSQDYKAITSKDSEGQSRIALLFLAWIYTLWEHKYRVPISSVLGFDVDNKKYIRAEVFGDLGKIRHAIIHNAGVKTSSLESLKRLLIFNEIARGQKLRCNMDEFNIVSKTIFDDLVQAIAEFD